MPDLQQELRPLAQADRHLADGAGHVAEQIALIEWMTKKGQDTTEAEKLLRNFKQILEQFRVHRRLILDAITRS